MKLSNKILSLIDEITEGMNAYLTPTGIQTQGYATQASIQTPGEEQTPTGAHGFDTRCPRLIDMDIKATVGSMGGHSYYEALEGSAYFATTVGVGKKAKTDGFIEPKSSGSRVFFSRSQATDWFVAISKMFGLKTFALITVNPDKCNPDGTFTKRLRVEKVEYVPVSKV